MIVKTEDYGDIEIPETKAEIILELARSKIRYMYRESKLGQYRIDLLEDALDKFRRLEEDV